MPCLSASDPVMSNVDEVVDESMLAEELDATLNVVDENVPV